MNTMKTILILIVAILIASCSAQKLTSSKPQIYWVNSLKVSCTGVAPMKCLQVQKNKTIEKGKWQNFYANIEGFDFQTGYIYKLSVKEEKIDPAKVPADGSSVKYTLVEVLEKNPDPKFRIHDIWALEAIDGKTVEKPNENDMMQIPSIEINLTEMRIMGTDGCNNFQGPIKNIEAEELTFGPIAATMKMCYDMEIPNKFNTAINKVGKYKIEDLKLYFFDDARTELLRFRKVD
jgi:heat shock protein HslJ